MPSASRAARARRDPRRALASGDPAAIEAAPAPARRWHTDTDGGTTSVAILDRRGVIVATNREWSDFASANGGDPSLLGAGASYLAACESSAPLEPTALACLRGLREMAAGERDTFGIDYRCDSPAEQRWFRMHATLFRGAQPERIVVTHTDVTERHREGAHGRRRESLFEQLDAAVVETDTDGRVTDWNDAAERLYGWSRADVLHRRVRGRLTPASQLADRDRRWEVVRLLGRWEGAITARRRDGSTFDAHCRTVAIHDGAGNPEGYVSVVTDISESLALERRRLEAADYLQAITNSLGEGLFALDTGGRVTFVNDTAADMLGWPREELEGVVMHDAIHHRRADGTPNPPEDCPVHRSTREDRLIRVTDDVFIRRDGSDLMVAYTAAPFHTERGVAGSVVVFRDISEEKARQRHLREEVDDLKLANQVREALSRGDLQLYAQPIVEIESRSLHSEELLLRMRDDDGSMIMPGAFLPAAARHGLMPQIDRWVLAGAIQLAQSGRQVALNLSSGAFTDFALLEEIEAEIDDAAIDHALLTFEVTETSIVEDAASAGRFLARLRELGCKLALDDFGTGYSGFTYLKHLPVDYLKIDIEFVQDLMRSQSSHHVVEAVVSLARSFGYKSVAEGVEDEATLQLLADLGVDYAQGFLIGRPVPANAAASGPAGREGG